MLTRFFDLAVIRSKLKFGRGSVIEAVNTDGSSTNISIAELVALNDLGATDLQKIDGITNGTVLASKAAVVDTNKDISAFRNVGVVNLDAGSSGVAGSLDVFPTTAAKGKLAIICADQSGDTTATLTVAAFAAARTVTIPDPGAAAFFVLTEAAQTVNGVKTFGAINNAKATNAITAFAGGGQSSGTLLTSAINSITVCATAGDSVRLPTSVAGQVIQVSNLGSTYANVFPISGDLIDALSANTALSLPVGKSLTFTCSVAGSWKSTSVVRIGAKFTTGAITSTNFSVGHLTGADDIVYENTAATPGTLTTRTGAQMFADDPAARVGAGYKLRITNNQGTGTLTVAANATGVTLTGTATIAINTWRDFVVTYTSATALVIQQVGSGTA